MAIAVAQPEHFQQIIENADHTLADLARQKSATQDRLAAIASEHSALLNSQRSRETRLAQAAKNAEQARLHLEEQEAYARLAAGTTHHEISLYSLASEHKRLRQEHERLLQQHHMLQDQDQAKLGDLEQEEQAAQTHLQDLEREIMATIKAKAAALRDWGQQQFQAYREELKTAAEAVAMLETQLLAAKDAEKALLAHGVEALARWPNHQVDLRRLLPVEDATSSILQASIDYIEALLTHGPSLPESLEVPALKHYSHTLVGAIRIPEREGVGAGSNIPCQPTWLRERQQTLAQALKEYRELQLKG